MNKFKVFIETRRPIIVGLIEIIIGLFCVFLTIIFPGLVKNVSNEIITIISDIGVGLVAAGIITASIEPITRLRMQEDIKEIKNASFSSLLEGVMPEEIFHQVQSQIIQQPFLREDVQSVFEMKWLDKNQGQILRKTTANYKIRNISNIEATYYLKILLSIELGIIDHSKIFIEEVVITRNGTESKVYDFEFFEKETIVSPQNKKISIPVKIKPKEEINISVKNQNIHPNSYLIYVMLTPTVNSEITIFLDKNMDVKVSPLHPSEISYIQDIDSTNIKRYKLIGGILPMQGFELTFGKLTKESD